MAIDLVDYEKKARKAVKDFWKSRKAAKQKQLSAGKIDQGKRAP
jgi:hypothetical protein